MKPDDKTLARHTVPSPPAEDPDGLGVLLIDIEPATAALFDEWLSRDGLWVSQDRGGAGAIGVIVIELAYPRQGGQQRLELLHRECPGVPIVVLSPTFLVGVPPSGAVARQLGAAAVLPAPVTRETLRATVNSLLRDSA